MNRYYSFFSKTLFTVFSLLALLSCSGSNAGSPSIQTTPTEANEQTIPPNNNSVPLEESNKYEDVDFSADIIFPKFDNPNCPDWQSGHTIEISESQTLPENCSFQRITLQFTKSDIEFDCSGALFNGLDTNLRTPFDTIYTENKKPHHFGFLISSHESSTTQLSNITLRNCQLINYVNAVFVVMGLSTETQESLRMGQFDEQSLRHKAPTMISLRNSRLINSHHHGIFVHRYVTNFELENTEIKGSGNSGLYIEAGSRSANIHDNTFEGNGFSTYSTTTGSRGPRKSQNSRREGIAIDGSRYNNISNNRFIANADGGVYLYKNCWEDSANPATIPRTEGANNNVIDSNTFIGEQVGVWLAERADRNLSNFTCGDPLVHEDGEEKYYRDYASENTLSNNHFDSVNTGIKVHDSYNTITGNSFINTLNGPDIEIGSLIRTITEDPVSNTVLDNNQTSKPSAILYH